MTATFLVKGIVQGVGFRPAVFRLARELGLAGWVRNDGVGVTIEARGPENLLAAFEEALLDRVPPAARIDEIKLIDSRSGGESGGFEIIESDPGLPPETSIPADLAMCPDCRRELFDAANRRFLYPFINCTNCGPRFSIIRKIPYDRPHTSMEGYRMCGECSAEYLDPNDRRFHAQPNCCPKCGPRLQLLRPDGTEIAVLDNALRQAAEAIRGGGIVALKGIGGFQLLADARNEITVNLLRTRKNRHDKPFALMVPDFPTALYHCCIDDAEERLLASPRAPIVLLRRRLRPSPRPGKGGGSGRRDSPLADAIGFANPWYGMMLPYSPLHALLMAELDFPIVATSGNLSEEPICIENAEALSRLREVADVFLVHDRPIIRPLDDSVARVMMGRPQVLRAARGYAPIFLPAGSFLSASVPGRVSPEPLPTVAAVGPHLKNTFAFTAGNRIVVSQHLGDLDSPESFELLARQFADLAGLYAVDPSSVACDLHPDYRSTRFAESIRKPLKRIQHHLAHAWSCLFDNDLRPPAVAVVWDGSGFGGDGTVWGGEFFRLGEGGTERIAHIRPFRLPGGEKAVREPVRVALALGFEIFGSRIFGPEAVFPFTARDWFRSRELEILRPMLEKSLRCPTTTSVGRLFDGIAAMTRVCRWASFEGQAAMALEGAAMAHEDETSPSRHETGGGQDMKMVYPIVISRVSPGPMVVDWGPMVEEIGLDLRNSASPGLISRKFHNTLVEAIVRVVGIAGESRVLLSGGCFQNKILLEGAVSRLRAEGFQPFWHERVPPNDGGVSLGQIVALVRG